MKHEVIGSRWLTGILGSFGAVAIVAVQKESGSWKAYLGPADSGTEQEDEQRIASMGAPLQEQQARGFFPELAAEKYSY